MLLPFTATVECVLLGLGRHMGKAKIGRQCDDYLSLILTAGCLGKSGRFTCEFLIQPM